MQTPALDLDRIRAQFPALRRQQDGQDVVYLDGPAGSQVPTSVALAVHDYLLHHNANHGGSFATSRATDAMVANARLAAVDFFGATDPEEVVFGANMTTLTFQLAQALGRTWRPGEQVVVSDSDHDANVTPWVQAALRAGCEVQRIAVRPDTTLDLDDARAKIGPRTRLVAIGHASNLSGTIHPVAELAELARSQGALCFVDAVHAAAHLRLQVDDLGADFVACSAYKFCGPHLGLLWGRRALLEEIEADRVRPAPAHGAGKWQTGTANFEGIAGTLAAIDYLASLGQPAAERKLALTQAFRRIQQHERALAARLLDGLLSIPDLRVIGLVDPSRLPHRCATLSFTHPRQSPAELCASLATRGIQCWAGNSYAIALTSALGLEPAGVLRLGLLHYNSAAEVDRVVQVLRELLAPTG